MKSQSLVKSMYRVTAWIFLTVTCLSYTEALETALAHRQRIEKQTYAAPFSSNSIKGLESRSGQNVSKTSATFLGMSLLEASSKRMRSADEDADNYTYQTVASSANFLASTQPASAADEAAADAAKAESDAAPADAAMPTKLYASAQPESDDIQGMTSAAMEAAITDLMMGKTKFGATPMGGSVKKIKRLLTKSMVPKVEAAHRADQLELDRLLKEIKYCGSARNSEFRTAKSELKRYQDESRLHKRCRADEAVRYTSKQSCLNDQKSKYQVKVLKCEAFSHISRKFGTTVNNKQIIDKGGSEGVETYVRRLSQTFCGAHTHGPKGGISDRGGWGGGLRHGMLDVYLQAKHGCQVATRAYLDTVKECKKKTHEYNVRKSQCNQYQEGMDAAACKRAVLVKDACESYSGCYYSKSKAFEIVERRIRFEERDRKAEWRGIKRIECLIDSFADGKVSAAEVDMCKRRVHSTSHLDILYHPVPPLVKCIVPTLYPTTGAYKRVEFAPLPSLAKGRDSRECSGMQEVETKPAPGSPSTCKCTRVALNGYYSAGPLVRCTNCLDVHRSRDKSSCPPGTKIFSPASREDWKTILGSVEPLRSPHWVVDVTREDNGCGGCTSNAMNSGENSQKGWRTSDGSPWWLRSSRYSEPSGDYAANCFMNLGNFGVDADSVSFDDRRCDYHAKSYYCQPILLRLTPKPGSPASCKCTKVDLAGAYSAGALVRCEHCLKVSKSTQKNSCPAGMKLFSPRSRSDWRTFLRSATPLRAPNWIVDVTRPQNGCGGCTKFPMRSNIPQQATWMTSDGSPWWLRDDAYREPNGDYTANCYLDLLSKPASADTVTFSDKFCSYYSRSYYCQPIMEKRQGPSKVPEDETRRLVPWSTLQQGLIEEVYYFEQGSRVPSLEARSPNMFRRVPFVYYRASSSPWQGLSRSENYAVRWSGILVIKHAGLYRFSIVSDDGSKLYIDNKFIINNDGSHSMKSREAKYRCKSGQHYLKIEMFQKKGKAGMIFMYRGRDTYNRMKTVSGKALRYVTAHGLKEQVYYTGANSRIPDMRGQAEQERVVPHVVYANTKTPWPGFSRADNFACRWSGFLSISRGGRYRFSLISDDGSKLYINRKQVVDNDGLHSLRNQEGIISLHRKKWPLKLEFFEKAGSAGMVFRYMGHDTSNKMRYVPRKAMFVAY